MPRNHRFHVVLCGLSSKWNLRAVSVNFSLNPIPAQKMTNWKKSVRRLIIIVLSLFFLLIIRASIWRPYGKNLAESLIPVTTKKMTNLQSTVTRFFVFTELFGAFYQTDILNSYFKILVESQYEGNDHQFAKYCLSEVLCCWLSVRHFEAVSVKFSPNPIVSQNMAHF